MIRYFRFAVNGSAGYDAMRAAGDVTLSLSAPSTCIEPAATAPLDTKGRILLAVNTSSIVYPAILPSLNSLIASTLCEDISEADYWSSFEQVIATGGGGVSSWNDLTDKPSTFAPSAHTQAFSTITATPTTLADYGITDALTSASLASPPAIGGSTPAAGTFTVLAATSRANLPSGAAGTPAARDLYAVADTIRYRDSGNVERLLLNSADNLASLGNLATARTNLGLAAIASSGSGSDITTGTVAAARLGSHASTHQTGGSDAVSNVVVSPTAISAATNNWSIGTGDVFRISASAAYDVTGIVAGTSGQTILLVNVGSFAITLKHQSASSTAANRFTTPWAGDCILAASGGNAVLVYDSTSSTWRVL